VSWIGKSKIQVFGCVDVTPGRMSYWMPGRKNSEGGELEGVVELTSSSLVWIGNPAFSSSN